MRKLHLERGREKIDTIEDNLKRNEIEKDLLMIFGAMRKRIDFGFWVIPKTRIK